MNDVLEYYAKTAPFAAKFLGEREVASRIWLPKGMKILKRGTKETPLKAAQVGGLDKNFFSKRKKHLDDVRDQLSETEKTVWKYFPPRKLADFFYATNFETGNKIDRVFFDIDRGEGTSAAQAFEVTKAFCEAIGEKVHVFWTGNSFHVFLMKKMETGGYENYRTGKGAENTLTEKWIAEAAKNVSVKVSGGHEKLKGTIIIDPSQTPPGKLSRAPFSLHITKNKIDGVNVPLPSDLDVDVSELEAYNPEKVLENLKELGKLVPNA